MLPKHLHMIRPIVRWQMSGSGWVPFVGFEYIPKKSVFIPGFGYLVTKGTKSQFRVAFRYHFLGLVGFRYQNIRVFPLGSEFSNTRLHHYICNKVWISVGSNPTITNFELLRTSQGEQRTHPNPGSSIKTELRTHSNPSKKTEHRTCLAKNGSNLGQNPEKTNLWTLLNPGSSAITELQPTQTLIFITMN